VSVLARVRGLDRSLLLTAAALIFSESRPPYVHPHPVAVKHKPTVALYLALLVMCILSTFGLINVFLCLAIMVVCTLIIDRSIFKGVDYWLLLTFVVFFIFAGNLSRIPAVHELLDPIVHGSEIYAAVLLSQVISNVPAAIMLSEFTTRGPELLVGINIGGLGMVFASLANLIAFRKYCKEKKATPAKFILTFSVFSVVFLIILIAFCVILYH